MSPQQYAANSHTIQKEFSPASRIEESICGMKVVYPWKFYYEESEQASFPSTVSKNCFCKGQKCLA